MPSLNLIPNSYSQYPNLFTVLKRQSYVELSDINDEPDSMAAQIAEQLLHGWRAAHCGDLPTENEFMQMFFGDLPGCEIILAAINCSCGYASNQDVVVFDAYVAELSK